MMTEKAESLAIWFDETLSQAGTSNVMVASSSS